MIVMPCRLGCTVLQDGIEVPSPGIHGGYCERDYDVIRSGFALLPGLIEHLYLLLNTPLRAKRPNLGNRQTRPAAAGLPFDTAAFDDLERARYIQSAWPSMGTAEQVQAWLDVADEDGVRLAMMRANWVRRAVLRWPTKESPEMSRRVLCPLDRGRVMVVPPHDPGADRMYVCSTCGKVMTEQEADRAARLLAVVEGQHAGLKKLADQLGLR